MRIRHCSQPMSTWLPVVFFFIICSSFVSVVCMLGCVSGAANPSLTLVSRTQSDSFSSSAADDAAWLWRLYQSTNGAKWRRTDVPNAKCGVSWTAGAESPCGWDHVVCGSSRNALGRVTEVDLANCNLLGTIPQIAFGAMLYMEQLQLRSNRLFGSLPWSLVSWRLPNLVMLDVCQNNLRGTLPASIDGVASQLQMLLLCSNQLRGTLPRWISNLTRLTLLYLDGNRFQGTLPASWGHLRQATDIDVSRNDLTGTIPYAVWAPHNGTGMIAVERLQLCQNCLNATATGSGQEWIVKVTTTPFCSFFSQRIGACSAPGTDALPTRTANSTSSVSMYPTASPSSSLHIASQDSLATYQISTQQTFVATSIAAAVVPLLFTGSVGGVAMQRAALQMRFRAPCGDLVNEDVDVDVASNPTRLSFGSAKGRSVRGSVVGNLLLLCAAVVAILVSMVLLRCARHSMQKDERKEEERRGSQTRLEWTTVAADVRFPSVLQPLWMFLLQPLTGCALACVIARQDTSSDWVVGIGGVCVVAIVTMAVARLVTQRFRAHPRTVRSSLRRKSHRSTVPQLYLQHTVKWRDRDRDSTFVKRFGLWFEMYAAQRHWFILAESAFAIAAGAVSGVLQAKGIRPSMVNDPIAQCHVLIGCLLAVQLCAAAVDVGLRPYERRAELVAYVISSCLGAGGCVAALLGAWGASEWCAAVQVVVTLAPVMIEFAIMSVRFWRRALLLMKVGGTTKDTPSPMMVLPVTEARTRHPSSRLIRGAYSTDWRGLPQRPPSGTLPSISPLAVRALETLVSVVCSRTKSQ